MPKKEATQNELILAEALRRIVEVHDKAADKVEDGFSCGCLVCNIAKEALYDAGSGDRKPR